eukprot:CAMPEP_0176107360 /NCGR_PEP_ID=MMETSP0120_2-20121206/53882_1 /TAXON_ID=160619 /ORGANISM="Kryptoperidinium foliaceum, Strain CCMP 1326" /LENGTH=424 /DNA_ID=CAMNT_0017441497 /DNA_START=45 /DNA_END=1319 /DNA_ORIENTATION=+
MAAAGAEVVAQQKRVAAEISEARTTKDGKPRIDCIDGCCFALVLPIILAHSARFGTTNKTLLKVLTQENVLVGGFFVIMGYITAYTSTKIGERTVDERKLAKPELLFWSRVMSYYPLHVLVTTAFAPMFVAVERYYNTPWSKTGLRAFLNYSMLQAWFPAEAEVWNQPSWFLSALTFSNLAMPAVLTRTAALSKIGLQKLFYALTTISVLQKLSFSNTSRFHSHNMATTERQTPLIWNLTRFHPFSALMEMTMGVVSAREVMMDTEADQKGLCENPTVYFCAAYATLLLRASSFDFNDAMIRSTLFVPLYSKFLQALHRDCLSATPCALTQLLRSGPVAHLGSLTFSMFLLHAPIGQLFYKKAVATRLWGKPMSRSFFPVYLAIVFVSSHLVNERVIKSEYVQRVAGWAARWLAVNTEGALQDS